MMTCVPVLCLIAALQYFAMFLAHMRSTPRFARPGALVRPAVDFGAMRFDCGLEGSMGSSPGLHGMSRAHLGHTLGGLPRLSFSND